jgi:hypothetical protein
VEGRLSQGVLLWYDNACPLSAAHTKEILQELKFEAFSHPPYSPDFHPLISFVYTFG